ncbi:cysteine desulfurase family protein [Bacillus massilinigeriensis]|uniref:cysteine desulfurase family protein n=1 Tax=Bacillus mediterraneensis TaxID=1805474 RepID=UPI0008F86B9A|nr:cysteine desulfurase family protein [Bacillus mediterraneensis]
MIYLDNSATTKPYPEVLDSYITVAGKFFGNPSSLHALGGKAEKLLQQARAQVAGILGVKSEEIVFTSGGTESNNLALKGATMAAASRGKHIILSAIEHPSVSNAAEHLKESGFHSTIVPVDKTGKINVKDIIKEIKEDTILVSVMHVNNETGIIQPINEIGKALLDYPKILFHVDYVQGVGKVPLDLTECKIDLCSISGHKFHGLKGTGALFVRDGIRLHPLLSGGNQEKIRRSGTENVAGAVSMAKALRMTMESQQAHSDRMTEVLSILRKSVEGIPGAVIHTPEHGSAPHILNFSLSGVKAEVFVHALEEKGIYVSTTSACSSRHSKGSKTLLAMGVPQDLAESAIRISLSYENTPEEAEFAGQAMREAAIRLREVMSR